MGGTKKILAETLAELMEDRSFGSITVKELCAACGISRQSFYYYFSDLYDLAEWIFVQTAQKSLADYSRMDNWQIGYVLILRWAQDHKSFLMNIYRSVPRDYTERFMKRVLHEYILRLVEQQARGMRVTPQQCEFIANFFTLSLNAVSLDWLDSGMKEGPEELAEQVSVLIQGDFQKALSYFEKKNIR